MCGDFNTRTSQEDGRGPLDSVSGSGEDECVFERSSQDLGSNAFGTELLNLCSALQCSVLNGIKRSALMTMKRMCLRLAPAQLTTLLYQTICARIICGR